MEDVEETPLSLRLLAFVWTVCEVKQDCREFWLWGLQGSFEQTNPKQWLLSLVCCLSWWLRPAVRPCCAASWPPAQTPLWHLSSVCTWAARPCPKAQSWQQAMCQPSWTLCPLVPASPMCQPSWTLCPLVPECQPTSRWPLRPLMVRSPSSALRTCTSWIRLRRKAWNCPTPAVLDLAPAALARCLRAALTRATRRSWMTTRWARDSASPASPMPPLMWPSRPTVRMSFEVAVRLWQSHHTSFPLGFFTMDFWPNAKSQEYRLTKWPLCSVNVLLTFSMPEKFECRLGAEFLVVVNGVSSQQNQFDYFFGFIRDHYNPFFLADLRENINPSSFRSAVTFAAVQLRLGFKSTDESKKYFHFLNTYWYPQCFH